MKNIFIYLIALVLFACNKASEHKNNTANPDSNAVSSQKAQGMMKQGQDTSYTRVRKDQTGEKIRTLENEYDVLRAVMPEMQKALSKAKADLTTAQAGHQPPVAEDCGKRIQGLQQSINDTYNRMNQIENELRKIK